MDEAGFEQRLRDCAATVESMLEALLGEKPEVGEIARPARLMAAMRHAALGGGKRLRPFLLVESARMLGRNGEGPIRCGVALECVHCYSLVHDDLPAMDDDDLRRGKPTVHRAFDEATAILAGDSLLTLAFEILADPRTHPEPAVRTELVALLSRAAGIGGMAGGQMLDLVSEAAALDIDAVLKMQSMKTGALFRFACEAGALMAGAETPARRALKDFGENIGAAFQLADDILDVTASAEAIGKNVAKDERRGKATLVALLGIEEARKRADTLVERAVATLVPLGLEHETLVAAARYFVSRGR